MLDESLLGPRGRFLCSDDIAIADYPRSMMAPSGEAVDCRFGPYPNIPRWLGNMKALKSRAQVNEAFYQCVTAPSKWKKFVRPFPCPSAGSERRRAMITGLDRNAYRAAKSST